MTQSAENLTDAELEQLCDAFVASRRAEFLDTDIDQPIQDAIERIVIERMRQAWHQGYVAADHLTHRGVAHPCASADRGNPYRGGDS